MRNKFKKVMSVFCAFVFSVFCLEKLFSEENFFQDVMNFSDFRNSEMQYRLNLRSLTEFKFFYFPEPGLSFSGSSSGNFEKGVFSINEIACFSLNQNLPGGSVVSAKFSLPANYYEESSDFFYQTPFSFSLEMPIFTSNLLFSENFRAQNDFYSAYKKVYDFQYKVEFFENLREVIECEGFFAYYDLLDSALEEKKNLLEERSSDYEKLYALGKISILELSDNSSERLEFYNELFLCKKNLLEMKNRLFALGLSENKMNFSLEEFILFWSKFFEDAKFEKNFQNELSKAKLKLNYFSSIKNKSNLLPRFSSSFNVSSSPKEFGSDFGNLGLENSSWSLDFAVSFSGWNAIKSFMAKKDIKMEKSIFESKIAKLNKEKSYIRENYEVAKKMHESYVSSMKENLLLEENRLKTYKSYFEVGRISEFDLRFQENVVQLSKLALLKSQIDELLNEISWY